MHATDGQLKAYLDGETDPGERTVLDRHLPECDRCLARLGELSAQGERVRSHFAVLNAKAAAGPTAHAAMARFRAEHDFDEKESLMTRIFGRKYRVAWSAAAVLAVLLVAFSFEPVRVWAGGLLGIFRVQQLSVVSIDPNQVTNGDSAVAREMSRLFSDSMKVTKEPGKPQAAADAADAGQKAGFQVRTLAGQAAAPKFTVEGASAFEFTVNRGKAQALLTELGSKYQLPAALDGATIQVSIPAGVAVGYNCPSLDQQNTGPNPANPKGGLPLTRPNMGDQRNCITLLQIPSPTVNTPPAVDVQQLAVAGLQMAGWSEADAQKFSQSIDWSSTLVIPIPSTEMSYQEVKVDGVKGYVLYPKAGGMARYSIVWVKDGIVYAVTGMGNQAQALSVENSLQLK